MDTFHNPPDPAVLARAAAKVKRHVLPLFVVMFIVNYIDRVNIGFVRSHMETDLGIGAAAYGLGAGLFFIGYAIFEVPSNLLLQRYGARAWLTRIMFTWGAAAMAMAFVQGETSFYVLRFILGAAEAGFFPGIIYYFTQWLPAAERGKAMAVFLSGSAIASVISGPVSGALLNVSGLSLHGWQWMFLIEGFASIVLCGFVWCWLQSHPREATWLSAQEKYALVSAIDHEQQAREAAQVSRPSMFKLLADKQIALFCFIYFSIALTIYGATFWLPSMIKKMGNLGDFQVGLFNSVVDFHRRDVRLCLPGQQVEAPAGLGRTDAGDRGAGHVYVDRWRAGVRLCCDLFCRDWIQSRLGAVLAHPPGLSRCADRGSSDRLDQFGGQPRRFCCAHHLRPA